MASNLFAQAEHKKNCTELGMAVLKYHQGRTYLRLYGRALRTTPLDAGPHFDTDPVPLLWSPRCSTVRSPTQNPRESVSKHIDMGRGNSQGVSRSVGGWAGKDGKTAYTLETQTKVETRHN